MSLKFLLLHVLLLTTVSCRPSSQSTLANEALPLGDARPVAESAELPSVDTDLVVHAPRDSPHPAPRRHGSQRQLMLQEEMHGGTDGVALHTEYECGLRAQQKRKYLHAQSRTWLIDEAVLDEVKNDLQVVVNCTQKGDTLLVDVRGSVKPVRRVTIPWNLTISSVTENRTRVVDGVYPRAPRKATFTCPNAQEGLFLVKTDSVVLANLRFEGCYFDGSGESRAIVEVEECLLTDTEGVIQLRHVSFEDNVLVGASGLDGGASSCSRMELVDVTFGRNECDGACGVVLSADNLLRDVVIEGVLKSGTRDAHIIRGNQESKTDARGIKAFANEVEIFRIEDGRLKLRDSEFSGIPPNAETRNRSRSSCIHLTHSTAVIDNCQFRDIEIEDGAPIFSQEDSDVTLRHSSFDGTRAKKGGAIALRDTRAFIKNVTVTSCSSQDNGGGIYAVNSDITADGILLKANNAHNEGGAIYIEGQTSLVVSDVTFEGNYARIGGAICARGTVEGHFTRVLFTQNSAEENGGSLRLFEANMTFTECNFTEGSAENGGFFAIRDNATVTISHSILEDGQARADGGCLQAYQGHLKLEHVTLRKCVSQVDGGAVRLTNATAVITNSIMTSNRAEDDGGLLYAEFSTIAAKGWIADGNAAGDHAGGLFVRFRTRISVRDSLFKNTVADNGGVVFQEPESVAHFVNVSFVNSAVDTEGGSFFIDASITTFVHCTFDNSTAANGGILYVKRNSVVSISSSTLKNGNARLGGCLQAVNGFLHIQDSTVQSCTSSGDGGAMHLIDMITHISNSNFSENEAENSGGAIVAEGKQFTGEAMVIEGNTANALGGGILFKRCSFKLADVTLKGNSAHNGGAVYQSGTDGSVIRVTSENNNCSGSGGTFHVEESSLNITLSAFQGGTAGSDGGFIFANSNSSVTIADARLINGRAERGGAISMSSVGSEATNLLVSDCAASADGGVCGAGNSSLLCTDCTLEGNRAEGNGGAFSLDYRNSTRLIAELRRCKVLDNAARFGGGLHVSSSDQTSHANHPDKCEVVRLLETSFVGNRARKAGGAVFMGCSQNVYIDCPSKNEGKTDAHTRKRCVGRLNSTDDVCGTWRENAAGQYGDDTATFASTIVATVRLNGENTTVSNTKDPCRIGPYRSGSSFPVAVRAVDDFGQTPATGRDHHPVVSTISSPDDLFAGDYSILMKSDLEFNVTAHARPGNYRILFGFGEETLRDFEIVVEVQRCKIGEESSEDKTSCEPCSAATYNFDLDDEDSECQPCPDNGNCTTRIILPNQGYWHPTPCSPHIQKCLSTDACNNVSRQHRLLELTDDVEYCDFNEMFIKNYTLAQCSEGYAGPLCGSCDIGYGMVQFVSCEECFSDAVNVLLVLLSVLVFLVLAAITMRANLGSTNPDSSARKMMVEVFKIAVNYAQVTAVAVSINVSWDLNLVRLFEAAELVSGVVADAIERAVHCLLPDGAIVERSVFGILMDIAAVSLVILISILFWIIVMPSNPRDWTYLAKRAFLSVVVVLHLGYISLTSTFINILNCIEVNELTETMETAATQYWTTDTSIRCHEGSHAMLERVVGWPGLILLSLGFPLITACVISLGKRTRRNEGWTQDLFGFMYQSYKDSHCYWECVVIGRKAVIAGVVVLAYPLGASLQVMFATFVFTVALYLQTACRPFRNDLDLLNNLESYSLLISLLTFISSLCFDTDRLSSSARLSIGLVILLLNLLFFFFLSVILLRSMADHLRAVLTNQNVSFDADASRLRVLAIYLVGHLPESIRNVIRKWASRLAALHRKLEAETHSTP